MPEALLAGLFGLLIGSFLNVCIHRMPRDLSVVHPRSRCPQCETPIAWYDNVPLFSWLVLGGRCRNCDTRISFRYLLVELLTGICFGIGVWVFGPGLQAVKVCVFTAIMIDLIFTDLEERILPDEFTLGGTLVGILFAAVIPASNSLLELILPWSLPPVWWSVLEALATAAFLSTVLWLIGFFYGLIRKREALGLGDVKMIACIGAFLGLSSALLALLAGSLLGSIISLTYIRLTGKNPETYQLPFGTFLGTGALVVALIPAAQYVL